MSPYGPPRGAHLFFGDGTCANDINAEEYIAENTARYDNWIAWAVSDIYARRWLQAVEGTREVFREKFAGELAEMRGLSAEVFYWLIDRGDLACVYERKETKQPAMMTDEDIWEEPPPIVREYFNIAFPVYREVTPEDKIPEWAGCHLAGTGALPARHLTWEEGRRSNEEPLLKPCPVIRSPWVE